MTRQCSSCGGFCKKSGCERENFKDHKTTEPIKLPTLPEPDWYLVMSADGDNVNAELRTSDEDAVNAALDIGGMVEIHRLTTIDKAEAYAKARVREALEEAAEIADRYNAFATYDAIRAIIPKEYCE